VITATPAPTGTPVVVTATPPPPPATLLVLTATPPPVETLSEPTFAPLATLTSSATDTETPTATPSETPTETPTPSARGLGGGTVAAGLFVLFALILVGLVGFGVWRLRRLT
jgi:hypothetical protein